MYCENRRRERRPDVIEMLKSEYRVQEVIDYSGLEHDGLFLEGTGAMVFDHWHASPTSRALIVQTPSRWSASARISISSRWCSTRPIRAGDRSITPTC